MKYRRLPVVSAAIIFAVSAIAADPADTHYGWAQCCGSAMPYEAPDSVTPLPDSLEIVMINHVGRHGARFPTSDRRIRTVRRMLERADSLATITPLGRRLLAEVDSLARLSAGQWGMLSAEGKAEQRGIARRLYGAFPELWTDTTVVTAMASEVPRCGMSMYEFVNELSCRDMRLRIYTSAGPQTTPLLRPFEIDPYYLEYRRTEPYKSALEEFVAAHSVPEAAYRMLGAGFNLAPDEAAHWAATAFAVLASMPAAGAADPSAISDYFSPEEANKLWACANLSQYLTRTSTVFGPAPSDVACDLLADLISTTDMYLAGESRASVHLRFGHAETMMPLLGLLRMPGCYYLTNYFDTVAAHWRNWYVVPMASNLQMIVARTASGRIYVRMDMNERPVAFMPGSDAIYVPWHDARTYMLSCMPLDRLP